MSETKIVRVISLDKRYRQEPYPSCASFDTTTDTYLTGQHIVPGNENTVNNLTTNEMLGKEKLIKAKQLRFPYVINPEHRIPIMHGARLILSKDNSDTYTHPKDVALYNYIMLQPYVAPSKEAYIKSRHYFYIEDKEVEAETRVNKRNLRFNAEKLIRENTAIGKMSDVAEMLSYSIKNFNINADNLTKTQIEDLLYKTCDKHPEEVIKCYSDDSKEDMHVIKLIKQKILKKTNDGIYDGSKFIGMTLGDVKVFMGKPENENFTTKWGQLLLSKDETKKKGL